uniref:Uncharacterized protein n=1 Tax=Ditylenchus dipsaci TaxID=166011 RepID=A0A915DZA7_9BILA
MDQPIEQLEMVADKENKLHSRHKRYGYGYGGYGYGGAGTEAMVVTEITAMVVTEIMDMVVMEDTPAMVVTVTMVVTEDTLTMEATTANLTDVVICLNGVTRYKRNYYAEWDYYGSSGTATIANHSVQPLHARYKRHHHTRRHHRRAITRRRIYWARVSPLGFFG